MIQLRVPSPTGAGALVRLAGLLLATSVATPALLSGQLNQVVPVRGEIFVGSELEDYLRMGQLAGKVPLHPWSIRGFTQRGLDRLAPSDSVHPWGQRYQFAPESAGGIQLAPVRPRLDLIYNSAFPYGANDGAIWAGRGVTTALQAGFTARWDRLSLSVVPQVFWAQNADFDMAPTGLRGPQRFADPSHPTGIDVPQRFGDAPYARADWGQSTLSLDLMGASVGVSTANQHWGPAAEEPLILGYNAPGFLHAFLGTAAPANLGVARVHGRLIWGRMEQSAYAYPAVEAGGDAPKDRGSVGVVMVVMPRGLPGLEIGGSRFFHMSAPRGGRDSDFHTPSAVDYLVRPFSGLFKLRAGYETDNFLEDQLASVFARWALPRSGFELYGELAREDHSFFVRDFLLEPDHISAYTIGLQKVWPRSERQWLRLRGEVVNASVSHLSQVRQQSVFYTHYQITAGHTQRGQILGSVAAYGGAGSTVALDWFQSNGRWTGSWKRLLRRETLPGNLPRAPDALHTLGVEHLRFLGRLDVRAGLFGTVELNRHHADDAYNLHARMAVQRAF